LKISKELLRSFLLLAAALLLFTGVCSAEVISLTPEEKVQWTKNSNLLDRKLSVLEMSLPKSKQELLVVEEKLLKSEERLARQEALLLQYENALSKTQETLKRFEDSLAKTEQLLKEERNAHKKQVSKLKGELFIWKVVAVAAPIAAATLIRR
jgi:septal ring factor EnvC (AmiA/AmiB activator)